MDEQRIITNPVKAIRAKCLDCMCGNAAEVKRCVCTDCPLFHFRMGKNPYRAKRELSEEQRAKLAEQGKKAAAARASKIAEINH